VSGFADLGFAKIDLARQQRCGFPEVIFGPGKESQVLVQIVEQLHGAGQDCLVTRVDDTQAKALTAKFPHGEFDSLARTFYWRHPQSPLRRGGLVLVVTAGTADLPVAYEAAVTARAFGCSVEVIADVGVAGLHRTLAQLERLRAADVVIVVAGMEAALPSVIGGLIAVPVIAVPTSVGYGAHFHGLAALLGMLNSCAANVAVVNIDAGFKAGYMAGLFASRPAASQEQP
jgi:NCAIR mutase (PurE)-related protein